MIASWRKGIGSSLHSLGENGWRVESYALFRALFGAYLLVHLAMLLPFAGELFSSGGMLPDASASPFHGSIPNPLGVWDAPWVVNLLVSLGVVASTLLMLGFRDRSAAVFLWFLLACLFMRNPLIANPSLPYVGWLLLAHALVPSCPSVVELARRRAPKPPVQTSWIPSGLFSAAWIVMAVGYSYSGLTKLASPSWRDGSAVGHVLENPLARPTPIREWMQSLPDSWLAAASYGALGLELGFVLLALSSRLRPWAWLAMAGMHLSLVVLIDFADLSMGMLMLHAFTFDPDWIRRIRAGQLRWRRGRLGLAAASGALLFTLAAPLDVEPSDAAGFPGESVDVIITNDGIRHAGLVLPTEAGPIEYGFGDLQWFALGRTQLWRAPGTLLLPSQAVLSRRPLGNAELVRLGEEHGFLCRRFRVPLALAEELEGTIGEAFEAETAEAAIHNRRHGMDFVLTDRRYSVFYNCHDQVARWLRRLEVRALPLPLRLRAPAGMEPCQTVMTETS